MRAIFGLPSVILVLALAANAQDINRHPITKLTKVIVTTSSDLADFGGAQQVSDLPGPDGVVSLREAIIAANNTPGPQFIGFNIPVGDPGFDGKVFRIRPQTALPGLTDNGTTIDGTTQSLFSGDTNSFGPEIVLDGSLAGDTAGITISQSDNHTIRGLVIHSFAQAGIQFNEDPTNFHPANVQVAGCYLGTDETGSVAIGNGWQGVAENGVNNLIGGPRPSDGNLISGNSPVLRIAELQIDGSGTIVQHNLIGTDRTGTAALGPAIGIVIGRNVGSKNTAITANRVSGNAGQGIVVEGSTSVGNTLSRNQILSNGGLGIDLNSDGITANDAGDTDNGPNQLMNFPVLTAAHAARGQLVVSGRIDTPNARAVLIEFFANPVPNPGGDPSGHGEGALFLGTARPDRRGLFTATLPPVPAGTLISATATDAEGNTSEFSANVEAVWKR